MPLAKNVSEFIDKASTVVARQQEDCFNQDCYNECHDLKIDSPIEQILHVAVKALAKIYGIQEASDPVKEGDDWHIAGLIIEPQKQIDRYRVDFQISHSRKWKEVWEEQSVIVECDSQQFHERTEPERRYEKRRARFLTSKGFKSFHFTGSEIINNPWQCAAEILAEVCTDRIAKEELLETLNLYLD